MNRLMAFLFFMLLLAGFALLTLKDMKSIETMQNELEYGDLTIVSGRWQLPNDALEATVYVQFQIDGKVTGFAGCNNFRGGFVATDSSLEVTALALTRKMCSADYMDTEEMLTRILEMATRYTIQANRLTITDNNNESLVLRYLAESNAASDK